MSDVVSFRPTPEEFDAIEQVQAVMGFGSRAEAVRFLLRKGLAAEGRLGDEPVFKYRLPKTGGMPVGTSSREIDETLYGDGK